MRIAATGHRPARLKGEEKFIKEWINKIFTQYDCTAAISGMAQGVDQIFARAAVENKIPLICCYPYKRNLHPIEQEIINQAQNVDIRFLHQKYIGNKVYWIRDKYMVDNCDLLIAVWDGMKVGGTWLTVNYAQKIGRPVIFYNFKKDKK